MRLEVSIQEDMLKEILEGNYKMNIAPSDLVDFGGQKSFDMTHQLFIQSKGTFVLMFDGRYGLNDPLEDYKPNDVTTVCKFKFIYTFSSLNHVAFFVCGYLVLNTHKKWVGL